MQEEGGVELWGGRNYLAWIYLRNIPFLWLPPKGSGAPRLGAGIGREEGEGFYSLEKEGGVGFAIPFVVPPLGLIIDQGTLPRLRQALAQPGGVFSAPTGTESCQGLLLLPWGSHHTGPAGTEMEHSLSCCAPQGACSFGSRDCTELFNILLSELILTSCTPRGSAGTQFPCYTQSG